MRTLQQTAHGEGHDYVAGSPHLKHAELRSRVELSLVEEVSRIRARSGKCDALEIGAGHGPFTATLRSAGATVTATEMSGPSAVHLTRAFADDVGVTVVHDGEGRWPFETDRRFDLIVAISVLHHIPDYEAAVRQYVELTRPGGTFVSWQDPMWYARAGRAERWLGRASYLIWRLGQGHYSQGLATRARRIRGILDEREVSDMSEYHVVRQGVDEVALQAVLEQGFDDVRVVRYWSTQAGPLQQLGAALGFAGTFALLARDRRP